jgi:hypothetical protein
LQRIGDALQGMPVGEKVLSEALARLGHGGAGA